jgi:hypothetical protein
VIHSAQEAKKWRALAETRKNVAVLHQTREIYRLTDKLSASQQSICSMQRRTFSHFVWRVRKIAKNKTISFVMSVRPHGTIRVTRQFSQNFIFEYFSKICKEKFQVSLTLPNPIFLPTAYSPALICFGRERG